MTHRMKVLIILVGVLILLTISCSFVLAGRGKPTATKIPTETSFPDTPIAETQPPVVETTPTLTATITTTAVLTSTLATVPEEPELIITGTVKSPKGWTLTELKAFPTVKAGVRTSKKKVEAFTGISIAALLKEVELLPDGTKIGFVNSRGQRFSYALTYIQTCPSCMLSLSAKDELTLVVPGMANPVPIKGVVEIQIYP